MLNLEKLFPKKIVRAIFYGHLTLRQTLFYYFSVVLKKPNNKTNDLERAPQAEIYCNKINM